MVSNANPFSEIALSLSGGGYRAAAFHLGTLDMLRRLGLLDSVKVISTVSGGTITGMWYAVSVAERKPFNEFYDQLYEFLRGNNVVAGAIENLSTKAAVRAQPSLIKGAAEVYARPAFLGDRRLRLLLECEDERLSELIFNATDFRSGVSFRFGKSRSVGTVVGNEFAQINKEIAADVRLADIVAASSCFPSAFEPIRFPDDFDWGRASLETVRDSLDADKAHPVFNIPVCLMDGGIFDNQGVDSVLDVYHRKGNEVGLFLISDTDRRSDSIYEFPPERQYFRLTFRAVAAIGWILLIISLVTIISLALSFSRALYRPDFPVLEAVFVYVIPIVFAAVVAFALIWLRMKFGELQETVYNMTRADLWKFLRNITVSELVNLLEARLSSLIAMSSSIFMNRIRDLVYKDVNVYPKYQKKVRSNLIYDLVDEARYGAVVREKNLIPSEALRESAAKAKDYPTNLWFFDEKDLNNLIACGQATVCFNILRYLLECRAEELTNPQSPASHLYQRAFELWWSLNQDPVSLKQTEPK
jgi:predicted acylesterase/phospholipase RssA